MRKPLVSSLGGALQWRGALEQWAAYQRGSLCCFGKSLDVPEMPKPVRHGLMASVQKHHDVT